MPSPLLTDKFLYVISGNDAIVSCFDADSGQVYFEHERLEGVHGVYASPVAARDRVYILSREGACVVLKKGPKPEVLAVNKLADDHSDASLALAEQGPVPPHAAQSLLPVPTLAWIFHISARSHTLNGRAALPPAPYTHFDEHQLEGAFFQRRRRGIYVELPSNKIQRPIGAAYSVCVTLLVCKAGKMPLLDGA